MAKRTAEDLEAEVRERIAGMSDADRAIAEPLHALICASAPELAPKIWYGQPAYAKEGKVRVFFRGADVDKERYFTLGFTGNAPLDDGHLWPTSFALTGLTPEVEARVAALVAAASR